MKTIVVPTQDPSINLALEEYLLKEKNIQDDVFYLWQNTPCVVIGRNQNPYNEINLLYAESHHIPVFRRISGGGTVYHDLGNINFTYITNKLKNRLNNYRFFVQPIIDILNKMGIPATFKESSHIYLHSKKISGNAQSFFKDKMMHHGTLLFSGDLAHLYSLLKPMKRYQTHTVDSTRSQTTNISEHLPFDTNIEDFKTFLLEELLYGDVSSSQMELDDTDWQRIHELADTKYRKLDWTFGETPDFWINQTIDGEVIQLRISKGRIAETSIYEEQLEGLLFHPKSIRETLGDNPRTTQLLQAFFD